MNILRIHLVVTIAAVGAFAQAGKDSKVAVTDQHFRIYHGDGREARMDELIAAANAAEVTFLGESHEDPVAHHLEAQILRDVQRQGLALSLEMFETDVQHVVDEYLKGLITEEHLMASGRAWRNYKSDYRPLVELAKEQKLPVIAANAPRRYVNRVSRLGSGALSDLDEDARRFLPPLPYAAASPEYAKSFHKVMEEARKTQGASDRQPDPVRNLEAQTLWDASMAFSIATFLTRNPGTRVLHCNGSFHSAYKRGIPEHLTRYRPATSTVVVTMIPSKSFPQFEESTMKDQGDFIIVTDAKLSSSNESATPSAAKPAKH